MTPEAKADLEAKARAATPGPWYQAGLPWFQTGSGVLAGSPDPHVGYMIVDTEEWEGAREEYAENAGVVQLAAPDADAAYIAAASPSTILDLLAENREGRHLVGETKGYDPEHPEWLGWDLRQIAENFDRSTGYPTASAQILRIAAHQFDGSPIDWTADDCRAAARALLGGGNG